MKSNSLRKHFLHSASRFSALFTFLLSSTPFAAALNIGEGTSRYSTDIEWDNQMSSVAFTQSAAGVNDPADISAVFVFTDSNTYTAYLGSTTQRLALNGTAGALAFNTGAHVTITGNTNAAGGPDSGVGGALYLGNNSAFTLRATSPDASLTFANNKALSGGAVYLNNSSARSLTFGVGVNFNSNTATSGNGGAIFAFNSLTLKNSGALNFSGNTAQSDGGAIYGNANLVLGNGVSFDTNRASNGGAVYADGALAVGDSAVFHTNTSTTNGGAIYTGGTLVMGSGARFTANEATAGQGYGGAIYAGGDATLGSGAIFGGDSPADGNKGRAGGAIYIKGTSLILGAETVFKNNTASGDGGGAIFAKNALALVNDGALVFESNRALGAIGSGGAIRSSGELSISGGATFLSNSSDGNGGAVVANGDFSVGGVAVFDKNTAAKNGGAVAAEKAAFGAAVTFGGALPGSGNQAENGGALYLTGGSLQLAGVATFNSNAATGTGGAVFATGNLAVANSDALNFFANSAIGGGGAIAASGNLSLGDSVAFSQNTAAAGNGGAIRIAGGSLALGSSATFTANEAASGGAIAATGALTITHSGTAPTFEQNTAALSGGAIQAAGALTFGGGVSFAGNTAALSGGAIAASGNVTAGDGVLFKDNTATTGSGGAILLAGNTLALGNGAVFSDNTAGASGGAIAASSGLAISHTGALVFTGNDAASGGAISSAGTVALGGNTLFKNNTAIEGGAVHAAALKLSATGGDIYFTNNAPNAAVLSGGASTFTGDRAIVFDDPLTYAAATASPNSLKSDAAIVQFAGNSVLNPDTLPAGKIEVTAGRLIVVAGATLSTGGASTSTNGFTLGANATLTGAGTIAAPGGIRISGTIAPDAIRYNTDPDLSKPGWFSGTEIGTLTLVGDSNLTGSTIEIQLGAGGTTDKLIVDGALVFGRGTTINVGGGDAGFSPDVFGPGSSQTAIIEATGGITGFDDTTINIASSLNASSYLSNNVELDDTGGSIVLKTSLAWYATSTRTVPVDLRAHGTFDLPEGKTFTVAIALNDHENNLSDLWRSQNPVGRMLTKIGPGTLVLAAAGDYSGGSFVREGTLRIAAVNAAGTGVINVSTSATLELAFAGVFANNVAGTGEIHVLAGADIQTNGTIAGANLRNNGTVSGAATYNFSASLHNAADGVFSGGNVSAGIVSNLGAFLASTVAGAVSNGTETAGTATFTATTVTGAIINYGAMTVTNVNMPAGELDGPLVNNYGSFNPDRATGSTVTGSVRNSGNFYATLVTASGTPAVTTPLVVNTGVFAADNVSGTVRNDETGAVVTVSGRITGGVNNKGALTAQSIGTPDAWLPTDGVLVTNSGSLSTDLIDGSLDNAAGGNLRVNTISYSAKSTAGDAPLANNAGDLAPRDSALAGVTIGGAFVNSGTARLANVAGAVRNTGRIDLPATATWGALDNSGGFVDFAPGAHTLTVDSLTAGSGDQRGAMRMDIDLSNPAASAQLVVHGEISGEHVFHLNAVSPNEELDGITVIVAPENRNRLNENVSGELMTPMQGYIFVPDDFGGYVLGKTSVYGPGAQAIANTIGAMSMAWFSQMDSLSKRFGEMRESSILSHKLYEANRRKANADGDGETDASAAPAVDDVRVGHDNSIWGRAYALRSNANLRITGMGAFYEYQYGFDVGADHEFRLDDKNVLFVGVFAGYQGAQRKFCDGYGSKGDTDSVLGGIYASWFHVDGWFLDAEMKGQYFSSKYNAILDHGAFTNYGFGASFRFGRRVDLLSDFFIEPSLQFSWLHVFAEDITTRAGYKVRVSDADIRLVAADLRLGKSIFLGDRGLLVPHIHAGVQSQISDSGHVSWGITTLRPNTDETRGIFGLGLTWRIDTTQQIHFSYDYVYGRKLESPWILNLGYRKTF